MNEAEMFRTLLTAIENDLRRIADAQERIANRLDKITVTDAMGDEFLRITQPGMNGRGPRIP